MLKRIIVALLITSNVEAMTAKEAKTITVEAQNNMVNNMILDNAQHGYCHVYVSLSDVDLIEKNLVNRLARARFKVEQIISLDPEKIGLNITWCNND